MYTWPDPSYHLPAFLEVWAAYAKDGHAQFYRDCADTSRVFLHRACAAPTGLNYDYTEFRGQPHATKWAPPAFRYDSWRVPMNIAMDYYWFGKDKPWQQQYARRLQVFLRTKGLNTFEDQFNVDGSRPDFILPAGKVTKLRHSLGPGGGGRVGLAREPGCPLPRLCARPLECQAGALRRRLF